MTKIILIAILFTVCISAQKPLEYLDNIKMKAVSTNTCIEASADNCCFTGPVIFSINYEGTKVNSFTLKGKQTGKSCTDSIREITVYPTKDIYLTQDLSEQFLIKNKSKTLEYNLITNQQQYKYKNDYCINIEMRVKNDQDVEQQLFYSSSGDKCESIEKQIKTKQEKEEIEIQKQPSFNNILLFSSFSFILFLLF